MKKMLVVIAFMLVTLALAAQYSGSTPGQSGGQATSPGSQGPGASQPQPSTPGSAGQGQAGEQPGSRGQVMNEPITEGCLGGSDPNFTITDQAGTTYKLILPPNANASSLTPHVGEPVQVMGAVKNSGGAPASIDVSRVGRGTGQCPAGGPSSTQPPPKQ